ncbi:MAG: PIN domain-containing protein [Pseudomonadota bacterium]
MKSPAYVIDACALIALINQETGSHVVLELLKSAEQGRAIVRIHAVNLCEVYYDCLRGNGTRTANAFLKTVKTMPMEIVDRIEGNLLKKAGKIKASEKVSLADAFAVGLAIVTKAHLVTADHHEIEPLERSGIVKVLWFR